MSGSCEDFLLLLERVGGNSQLKLHTDNLEKVLLQIGEKPLAILSVVGTSPQNKNFLIGFLIRYLESLQSNPIPNDFVLSTGSLHGFLWKDDCIPDSDIGATWIFSRPFSLKNASGTEIAVILLYTQLPAELLTEPDTCMDAIIGLNMLISSTFILDCFRQLPQKLIKRMEAFIKCGLLGGEENMVQSPFQSLKILIRDWTFPAEYPFGEEGGKKLLEKIFLQTKDSKAVKEKIEKYFKQLSCHLAPFPGSKAISPQFKGIVEELDPVYQDTIKKFIRNFIQVENFHPSKIHEQTVSATSLKTVLESYILAVNSGSAPKANRKSKTPTTSSAKSKVKLVAKVIPQVIGQSKPISVLDSKQNLETDEQKITIADKISNAKSISTSTSHESLVKKAFNKYKETLDNAISNPDLEYYPDSKWKIASSSAIKASRDFLKRKIKENDDDRTTLKALEKLLKGKIEEESEVFTKKNQSNRNRYIENAITEYTKKFQNAVKVALLNSTKPLDNNQTDTKSGEIIQNLVTDFKEKLKLIGEEEITQVAKQLETKLGIEEENLMKQKIKQEKESMELSKYAFNQALSEYKSSMSNILASELPTHSLDILHAETRETCFRKLKLKLGESNNPLFKRLESEIEYEYQMLKEQQKTCQERLKALSQSLIEEFINTYSNELDEKNEIGPETSKEQSKYHQTRVEEIVDEFKAKIQSQGGSNTSFGVEELRQDLSTVFSEKMIAHAKLRKEREKNLQNALVGALSFYQNEMSTLLAKSYFLNDQQFESCNENIIGRSYSTYLGFLQQNNIPASLGVSEETLKLKLSRNIREFKLENNQKRNLANSETKNLVRKCIKVYTANMTKGMVLVWNQESLQNLHNESIKIATTKLQEECVKKDDPEFLTPFLDELGKEIELEFEEIEELFEMRSSAETDSINIALAKGWEEYNDEMDKHFKNHEFIKPEVLECLHKDVSARVIKSCLENNAILKEAHKLQLQEGINLIFEKYKQQNDINLQVEPAIGIDLGTTYSCVAIYAKGKVHIIRNSVGKNTTPSYVSFNQDGKETVGEPAKNRAYENPENTIFDAKRIIGRRFNDPKLQSDMKLWPFTVVDDFGVPKILIGEKKLHPEEISAKVLSELKRDAENYLQREVTKAVITVPAYFTDGQRQATKDAGTMAGLEVLNVQTEPTAAAIAYKLQHSEGKERNVLIFDLVGGTFDVAVLKMKKGNIEVLAVDGDTHLGGEDFDKNMMEYCAQEFKKQNNIDLFEGKDSTVKTIKDQVRRRLKRLQRECERKKIELATARRAVVTVDRMHETTDLSVVITREIFDQLNEVLFVKTITVVDLALKSAKLDKSKIDDIVLVGGSTRIPKVQELLGAHFGGKALDHYINPDEAVAYGAAMTAAYMNGTIAKNSIDFNKIQDVTPMSIGVEVYGGNFSVIIPKSTKIPVKLMERYKTAHNNQTSVQITIYQGEDEIAVNNQHLGDFYLNGIPPKAAEVENIDVEMVINSQGILHVSAVSSSTGQKSVSIIENKFRMGRGAIQQYLQEAPA